MLTALVSCIQATTDASVLVNRLGLIFLVLLPKVPDSYAALVVSLALSHVLRVLAEATFSTCLIV